MPFRLAFVLTFALVAAIAARGARRAARRHGGGLDQRAHEVPGLLALRGGLGLVFYGALAAWLFAPGRFAWAYVPVPRAVRWLAVVLLAPVVLLFARSFAAIGDSYRGGVGLWDDHRLATDGPYRRVRHPIYLAFILVMLLMLPLTTSWPLALSGLLLVSSIPAARIPIEERELAERFGARWHAYRARTGRLLPRPRGAADA